MTILWVNMILTYKNIRNITFPIYKLPNNNWYSVDGLVYLDGVLLDDTNQEGYTIGIRRIRSPFKDFLPLKNAITDPIGLFKNSRGSYIDIAGKLFIYEKTKIAGLKYYKIRKVQRKDTCSTLWLEGINFSFTIPRPPNPEYEWAGVLHLDGKPWMLYEYSERKCKDTRRKI